MSLWFNHNLHPQTIHIGHTCSPDARNYLRPRTILMTKVVQQRRMTFTGGL